MYWLVFLCCVFCPLWANHDLRSFIDHLDQNDQQLLDKFLRRIVQSINGFVIYGDKPLALFSCANNTVFWPSDNKDATVVAKGKELWQSLNISPEDKNYALVIFNANGYCNFVAINKKAFIKVVNENLALFRYVLGPTLTAQNLLESLLEAGDDFYHVFKNDNVLFGILLGYGTQNALLVSRLERLSCDCVADQKECFPFLPYKAAMHRQGKTPSNLTPSMGYAKLADELEALAQEVSSSHDEAPLAPYALPFFGCDKNSQETQSLLAIYQENQRNLLAAVEDPDFFYKTLLKFLQKESGEIDIPKNLALKPIPSLPSKEEASTKLADVLAIGVAYEERRSQDLCLQALLEGIEFQNEHREESIPPTGYNQMHREAFDLGEELRCVEGLQNVDSYFHRLGENQKIECLIPQMLYYKVLKKGFGETLSRKANRISFHYTYKIQGNKKLQSFGTVQEASLDSLISGIAHALIGMKRGEERWVAIHPNYGYGNDSFFPPNSSLLVNLMLIDFEKTDHETEISLPYECKPKNPKVLARYEALKTKIYHERGRDLWQKINQVNRRIDLKILKKAVEGILADERDCPFQTMKEAFDFSLNLQDYLSQSCN